MIQIQDNDKFYSNCQVCHVEENMYSISISDGRYGVEVHLCKECLEKLSKEIDKHLKKELTK